MNKLVKLVCILVGVFLATNINASAQTVEADPELNNNFKKGDMVINAGIGLGSTYTWGGLSMPLGGGLEYGVTDLEVGSIGVGGDLGFISGSGLTITYIGAKGSYHFNEMLELENDDLDVYGGLGLYYRHFNYSGIGSSFGSGVMAGFHVGSRYYFADNIGGYAELGNNWGWLNIGVVFKM